MTSTQTAQSLWNSAGKTVRLWLKSPNIAFGLLEDGGNDLSLDTKYWKYRLSNQEFSVRSIREDPNLQAPPMLKSLPNCDWFRILSFKPESRLAFTVKEDNGTVFCKTYRAKKYLAAREKAKAFDRTFQSSGMRLSALIPSENRINWAWLGERSLMNDQLSPELPLSLLDTDRYEEIPENFDIPVLTPLEVARHLEERMAALSSWATHLMSNESETVHSISQASRSLMERLNRTDSNSHRAVLHGDFRPKNVVIDSTGAPRLCDADHVAIGDPEWDLAAWLAEFLFQNSKQADLAFEAFATKECVDRERLCLYCEVWRLLYRLKELEDQPVCGFFLISHDLSGNALGRAVLLAQLLGRRHQVEIIGACFGPDVWYPARRAGFKYRKVDGEIFLPEYTHLFARLIDKLKGDLVVAVKPRPTSFGVALMGRELTGRPLLLDIDDLELAYYEDKDWRGWDRKLLLRRPNSPLFTALLEHLISTVDGLSVASRTLQNRYGGTYLPHVKDPDFLDPSKYDKAEERQKRRLSPDEKLVFFVGSPREHKGPALLQSAINRLDRKDVRLVVFGMTNQTDDPIESELRERGGDRFYGFKQFPFSELPAVLSMADIAAIPQESTPYAEAQAPSKLFDAMSMALPIVGTSVSDIPEALSDDCGKVVPPDDERSLATAIGELLESPESAARLGENARERLVREYSFDAVMSRVETLIEETVSGRSPALAT